MITEIWWLFCGHFLGDYVFQSSAMATGKRRAWAHPEIPATREVNLIAAVPWYFWMLAHALTHGLIVSLITHSIGLGIGETIAHFLIDWGKCEGLYGHWLDQCLHMVCKAGWLIISTMEV